MIKNTKMNILITGGAGYIGSHMVERVLHDGHSVTVLDNLSTGHSWAIKGVDFHKIDLLDKNKLNAFFQDKSFDGVVHFAGKSLVGESIINPEIYYQNNVIGSLNLLNAMKKNDISKIVFSSTAAVYGIPKEPYINEEHIKKPINPYGHSKYMIENILSDFSNSYGLDAVCLRYFNAAGASKSGNIGEAHEPETHLIPNILKAHINNKKVKIFGDDYNTADGTCIRDYIHVIDLIDAHMLSLDYLFENPGNHIFNLGNGNGFSVLEVIKTVSKILDKEIIFDVVDRRTGDPDILVANSKKALRDLGWIPKFNKLDDIIQTAWDWHKIYESGGFNG